MKHLYRIGEASANAYQHFTEEMERELADIRADNFDGWQRYLLATVSRQFASKYEELKHKFWVCVTDVLVEYITDVLALAVSRGLDVDAKTSKERGLQRAANDVCARDDLLTIVSKLLKEQVEEVNASYTAVAHGKRAELLAVDARPLSEGGDTYTGDGEYTSECSSSSAKSLQEGSETTASSEATTSSDDTQGSGGGYSTRGSYTTSASDSECRPKDRNSSQDEDSCSTMSDDDDGDDGDDEGQEDDGDTMCVA